MSILITLALFTVGLAFAVAADGEAVTPGDYTVYADTACTEAVAAYDDFVTALENATAGQCVVATTAPETLREPEKNIADGIYVKFGTGVEIDTQNTPYVFTEVADADYLSVDVLEYEVTVDGAAKIYVDADDETNGNLQTIVNMGTSVTISLMQDANAYSLNGKNNLCAIESSQTINIDVNGYTINLDKLSYTSGKFTVSGKFYVYSSRVGGVIDCADGNTFARANGTFGDGVIQFGNEGDKLEDGLLTVFADQVLTGQDTATVSSTSGAFSAYGVSFVNNDIGNAVMFSTYTRMTFTFENCSIFIDREGTSRVLGTANGRPKIDNVATLQPTGALNATFTNCKIAATKAGVATSVLYEVRNRTGNTDFGNIVFDNCDIIGSIVPADDTSDFDFDNNTRATVTLKNGTRVSDIAEAYSSENVVFEGDVIISDYTTEDFAYNTLTGTATYSATYKYVVDDKETADPALTAAFTIALPDEKTIYAFDANTLDDEITNLPCDGALITLLSNVTFNSADGSGSNIMTVSKSVKINLNGKTIGSTSDAKARFFYIAASDITIDIYSNAKGARISPLYSSGSSSYMFFYEKDGGVTINLGKEEQKASFGTSPLDYMNTACAVLLDARAAKGKASGTVNFNIHGGSHMATKSLTDAEYISARHRVNLNINYASFLNNTAQKYMTTDAVNYDLILNANITGSRFTHSYSSSKGYFFKELGADSSVVFDNCILMTESLNTSSSSQRAGKIYLRNNTIIKISEDTNPIYTLVEEADQIKVAYSIKHTNYCFKQNATQKSSYSMTPTHIYVNAKDAPDFSGVKVNLTANNGFFVNFYVPQERNFTMPVDASSTVTRNDVTYDVYTVGLTPGSVDAAAFNISFTLKTDSTFTGSDATKAANKIVSTPLSVSLLNYFKAVLASETQTEEAKTLVVNAVNYCNAVYNYVNGEGYEAYTTILTENAERVIPADAAPVEVNAKEQGAFSTVQFIIGEGNVPMFAFTKVGEGAVSIKFTNIYGEADEIECEVVTVKETDYYAVKNMPVYEMVGAFVVCVDGAEVGNYSIANYINDTNNEIVTALYGYGVAVKNWKIED